MKKISKADLIKLSSDIGILKKVIRTGWKKKGIKDPESVAEHSFRVTAIAMFIAAQLGLDQNKLMKMSLIHDLGEITVGDLIWEEGKRIIGSQKDKHSDEKKAVENIFNDKPELQEYMKLWKEFEQQKTKEAKIVKQIDKLEMALQALEYEKEGYSTKDLQEFWDNAEKYLNNKELGPIFRTLQKVRNTQT